MVGLNPEVGHEQMAGLNFVHGIAQALWHGKLFHIDLNGQRGIKYDQDLVFGHGDLLNAFFLVDLLEFGGPRRRPGLRRPAALRLQAVPHRGHGRRVGLGRGEHAHVPAAQGAGRGVPRRPRGGRGAGREPGRRAEPCRRSPTGESYADLLADRSAFEDFDVDAAAARGFGFVRAQPARGRAPARRAADGRSRCRSWPGSTRRPSRARWSSGTPRPARWSGRAGRRHPDGTEVDPDAWWSALRDGRRRRPAAWTTWRPSPSAPSSTAWSASTRTARWSGRRCCGTTPAPPAPPPTSSPSWRRRGGARWAERRRQRAGRLVHRHQAALAGRARAGAAAARTAAVCLPHDWLTWRLAGAPATSAALTHRPGRRQRHRLLVARDRRLPARPAGAGLRPAGRWCPAVLGPRAGGRG